MSQAGNYPDCEICEYKLEKEAAQKNNRVSEPSASDNNERDVICSKDPCDYCCLNCANRWLVCKGSYFEGRKLTPVS